MKIQCKSRPFVEAVSLVSSVVSPNPTRPVLQSLYVSVVERGLFVQGTDLEVGLSVRVDEVLVGRTGDFVVSAARLNAVARELHDEQLSLELAPNGDSLEIKSGRSQFRLPCSSPEEYPRLTFPESKPQVRLHRKTFLDLLRKVSVAAAKDATRYQMHSVLFDCQEHSVRLVSTDGKRLALANCQAQYESAGQNEKKSAPGTDASSVEKMPVAIASSQHIIPLKGVDLIVRILSFEDAEFAAFNLSTKDICYVSDRVSLSCNLVEGKFPPYERALPPAAERIYGISSQELLIALRQASLMTTKDTNSVQFQFDADKLVISTQAATLGESRIELTTDVLRAASPQFFITFNPGYLIDLLKVSDGLPVALSIVDRKTAGSFTFKGLEDSYRHIVMPLVTDE
ncbi:MAG: DNA polymerase III subunit beta [Planctomycetota bacterium]